VLAIASTSDIDVVRSAGGSGNLDFLDVILMTDGSLNV
jgi:hypothetical protein